MESSDSFIGALFTTHFDAAVQVRGPYNSHGFPRIWERWSRVLERHALEVMSRGEAVRTPPVTHELRKGNES